MRLRSVVIGAVSLLSIGPATVRASILGEFMHRDIDVITVTDVTDAGRAYPPATSAKPVRYMLVYVGLTNFGPVWAGESIPPKKEVLKWMVGALRTQGYLLADQQHPPQQLLVFGWGMLAGNKDRAALGFLGGDKVNLMWEQEQGHSMHSNVLLRGLIRLGVAGKVWDIAEDNLFLGVVRSFTMDSLDSPKTTQLWETRFACPSTGLAFDETMPHLIKAAAVNFGRETTLPVNVNTSERNGHVKLGEMKFLEADPYIKAEEPNKPDEQRLKTK